MKSLQTAFLYLFFFSLLIGLYSFWHRQTPPNRRQLQTEESNDFRTPFVFSGFKNTLLENNIKKRTLSALKGYYVDSVTMNLHGRVELVVFRDSPMSVESDSALVRFVRPLSGSAMASGEELQTIYMRGGVRLAHNGMVVRTDSAVYTASGESLSSSDVAYVERGRAQLVGAGGFHYDTLSQKLRVVGGVRAAQPKVSNDR